MFHLHFLIKLYFLSCSLPKFFGCLYIRNCFISGLHAASVVSGDDLGQKPSLQVFFQLYSLKSQDSHRSQMCCRSVYITYTGPLRAIHQKSVQCFFGFYRSLLSSKIFPVIQWKYSLKTEIYCVDHQRSVLDLELHRICIKGYGNWIKYFLM